MKSSERIDRDRKCWKFMQEQCFSDAMKDNENDYD